MWHKQCLSQRTTVTTLIWEHSSDPFLSNIKLLFKKNYKTQKHTIPNLIIWFNGTENNVNAVSKTPYVLLIKMAY